MAGLQLKKATSYDVEYLLALRLLTMQEHLHTSGLDLTIEQHKERLMDNFENAFLVINDSQTIGMVKYHDKDGLVFKQIQIHPDFQGQGIGRQLIEQLAAASSANMAYLSVLKTNPALALYKRLGFEVVDEDEYEFYMEKRLN